jgi:hypothetical protein
MGKRKRDTGVSLDSFLDILTCLQGVLMLIIITTGIDAAQTKIIMATPIELSSGEKSIYIEARDNMLFEIPFDEARRAVKTKSDEIISIRRSSTNSVQVLDAVGSSDIDIGDYVVDFSRYLTGQIALIPKPDTTGYIIQGVDQESSTNWFGSIVANMDLEGERLYFMVRDNSFEMFKLARLVAWKSQAKVTYSLISRNEPIVLGNN